MQSIIFFISIIFIMGCSDKSSHLQDRDTEYQRFLDYKTDKTLKRELENYDKK